VKLFMCIREFRNLYRNGIVKTTRSKSVGSQPQSVHSPIREDTNSIYVHLTLRSN